MHLFSGLQEMLDKAPQLPTDIQWHFIGHLQSNKVKAILGAWGNGWGRCWRCIGPPILVLQVCQLLHQVENHNLRGDFNPGL